MTASLTALGVSIFAGGFTLGVKAAGFDVLAHFEETDYGVSSAKANWPDLPIHVGPENWPRERYRDQVDLIYSNPPCAIFSSMGIATSRGRDAWKTDPRTNWWRRIYALLDEVRPKILIIESVTQAYTTGRSLIDELTLGALSRGYGVTHILVDAKWFGIPQARRRFFFVVHRAEKLRLFQPDWTKKPPTIGQTLGTVKEPGVLPDEKHSDLLMHLVKSTPPGKRLSDTFDQLACRGLLRPSAGGKISGRPSFLDKRLHPDEQSGAFTCDKFWHPTEDRKLGLNEMLAVCGYPPDFKLVGPSRGYGSLLARAVMPPVGRWLAEVAAATLRGSTGVERNQSVTFFDLREPGRESLDLTTRYTTEIVSPEVSCERESEDDRGCVEGPEPIPTEIIAGPVVDRPEPSPRQPVVSRDDEPVVGGEATDETVARPGEGSGKLIQRLWLTGRYSPDELVEIVHRNWSGRTTTRSDVYYNYRKLLSAETPNVPPWPTGRARAGVKDDRRKVLPTSLLKVPAIVRPEKKRIVFTGFTTMQALDQNDRKRSIQKIDVPAAIVRELRSRGVQVDWTTGDLLTEREPFTAAIVCLGKMLSLHGVRYAATALWTLYQAARRGVPTILFYDDWKISEMQHDFRYTSNPDKFDNNVVKRFVNYAGLDIDLVRRRRDELLWITEALTKPWPAHWTALFPRYRGWGDVAIPAQLTPAGRIISIDPTPVEVDLTYVSWQPKKRGWFLAALGDHSGWVNKKVCPTWPVTYVGHKNFGPKLATERDVCDETAKHHGTLCPPYDHTGSGWFRARYVYAALSRSILFSGPEDQKALGDPYRLSIEQIEGATDVELDALGTRQHEWFFGKHLVATTRREWENDVTKILEVLNFLWDK